MEMLLQTLTWPPPICCASGAAISEALSTASPHFDPTIRPPAAESGLIAEPDAPDTETLSMKLQCLGSRGSKQESMHENQCFWPWWGISGIFFFITATYVISWVSYLTSKCTFKGKDTWFTINNLLQFYRIRKNINICLFVDICSLSVICYLKKYPILWCCACYALVVTKFKRKKTPTNISEFYKEERKNRFLTLKLASSEVHFLFIWTTELLWKWFSRWPGKEFQFSRWCHCDQIFILFFITGLVFNFFLLLLLPTKCSVWT